MNFKGIYLIHTKTGVLPRNVQRFQMRLDKESGYWNHSGIVLSSISGTYIFEASTKDFANNHGRLSRAGAYINPAYIYYNKDNYEILLLEPNDSFWNVLDIGGLHKSYKTEYSTFYLEGTPYDFKNLLGDQIVQYLIGRWIGRTGKAAKKRMVCHELTMNWCNLVAGRDIFPGAHRALVKDIYYSPYFNHRRVQ